MADDRRPGQPERKAASVDPFDGQAPYFREVVREKRLNLILHLASYGEVLLVQGEAGSGRSRFLARIHERARASWRVCLLAADPAMSEDVLEIRLRDGLGLEQSAAPGGDGSVASLRRQLADLKQEHLSAVALIDDADTLPDSALALLAQLVESREAEGGILSVVLACKPGFPLRLHEASVGGLRERIGHVFEVPPFTVQDSVDYMHHCLQASGVALGPPFTMSAMRLIHTSSQGLPAKINPLARRLFWGGHGQQAQPADVSESKRDEVVETVINESPAQARRPWSRVIFVMVVLTLAVVWWQQDAINRLFQVTEEAPLTETPAVAEAVLLPEDAPEQARALSFDEGQPAVDAVRMEEEPRSLREAMIAARAAAPSIEGGAGGPGAGGQDGAAASHDEAVMATLPEAVEVTEQPVSGARDDVGAQTGSGASSVPEPVVPEPAAETPVTTRAAGGDAPAATMAEPMPPSSAKTVAENGGGDWLAARTAGHFTLQLIALSPEQARRFVKRHGLQGEAVLIERRNTQGKALLGVLYGDFASRDEAVQGSARLQLRIPGIRPWIRRFADIQAELARR